MNIKSNSQFPGGRSLTYVADQQPGQDPETNEMLSQARALEGKVRDTIDLFSSQDQSEADLDRRIDHVRLKDFPAPGLLEDRTSTVSGFMGPKASLWVQGKSSSWGDSLLTFQQDREAYLELPMYANGTYAPTVESLFLERDSEGLAPTRVYSWAYAKVDFNEPAKAPRA